METKKQIKDWKQYKGKNIYYKPYRSHKNGESIFDQVFIKDKNFTPAKIIRPKLEGIKNNQDAAWRKSLQIVKKYFLEKSEEEKIKKAKINPDIMINDILNDYFTGLANNIDSDVKAKKTTERRAGKNKSSNQSYLDLLSKAFEDKSIKDIKQKDIEQYVYDRRNKSVKDGSIGTELGKLSTAVQTKLKEWNLDSDLIIKHQKDYIPLQCINSIIHHVKETKDLYSYTLKEPITYEEYLCTIGHITNDKTIDPIYDCVFAYMFWTGARCGEVFELSWDMVNFKDRKIVLPEALIKESKKKKDTKTKAFSTVKEVWSMLERLKEKATKEKVVIDDDDGSYNKEEVEPTGLVFVKKSGKSVENGYLYAWEKIKKACHIVYSENPKKHKKARNFRNAYVDLAREAEHNGAKGSQQATGHSGRMEEYYATKWETHLRFIEKLEDWKKKQEKEFGVPDRVSKSKLDIIMDSKFN